MSKPFVIRRARPVKPRQRRSDEKQQPRAGVVIVDNSFGFGRNFGVRYAEWNDKTVTFWFDPQKKYTGSKHRRSTQLFVIATKELAHEAAAINKMQDDVDKRARKLSERLKEMQPK